MSGYDNNYPDTDLESGNGGGLRKQLEELLAQNKKLNERLDERDRGKTVTDLLTGKGIDPAVAELIPQDADPKEWVEKYAHLLGVKTNEPVVDNPPAADLELQLADDSDPALVLEREALAAMQNAQESGLPASVTTDLIERMNKIDNEEEFLKLLKTGGAVAG